MCPCYIPPHTARIDPVIGFSAGGSEANVTFDRQRLLGEGGEGNFDTTINSALSDNSSVAPICCGHPQKERVRVRREKCSDDGRGPVKTLSGRLARKLQRSASLVNAGLSKQIQTVLDAATVDRCDFVEICCSDALCLTEAMQRRGLSSFSLLRSDGVGNHDAKTREKILSWLSEKRPQKAWLSPPVVTHQNNSTLRSRQIFRQFFGYAAAVLSKGGHIYWEWPAKCIGWSSMELREFRAQRKSCGRELFMTACDSCYFAKRENNLLESSAQETEKDISPAERERVRKLIHRLHVSGGHASSLSCLDEANG